MLNTDTHNYCGSLLASQNAVITGSHFVYTKPEGHGDHGDAYVNKDAIYPNPEIVSALCYEMASRLIPNIQGQKIAAIVGPEKGAIILSTWVTIHLRTSFAVNKIQDANIISSVYAEKADGGKFVIRRGYDKLVKKERGVTIIVEDILNSGGTAEATIEAVRNAGGEPYAVTAICNRGGVTAEKLGVPVLQSLISFDMVKYPELDCPLCKQGIPVRTDLGHGAEFLRRQRELVEE